MKGKEFATALAAALASKKVLDAANETTRTAKENFDSHVGVVTSLVQEPCDKGIEAFNKDASMKVQKGFKISFDTEKRKINLSIRLRWPSGLEPDEDFDFDDRNDIREGLAKLVDAELEAEGIAFTLGEISVPTDYYPK